jgi:hypothetical protein
MKEAMLLFSINDSLSVGISSDEELLQETSDQYRRELKAAVIYRAVNCADDDISADRRRI